MILGTLKKMRLLDEFQKKGGEKRDDSGTKRSGILPFRRRVALNDHFHDPCSPVAKLCGSPSV